MKITSVILCLFGLLVIGCNSEKNNKNNAGPTDKQEQDDRITAKTIESIAYKDYALSSEAESIIIPWEKYQELATQISYLKKGDFSFFNGDKELLKTFISEFKAQMPEELQTKHITSRNAVIETALLNLNEKLTLDNIDRDAKILGIKELFIAFSNLNYLINKKLERDFYDKIQPE